MKIPFYEEIKRRLNPLKNRSRQKVIEDELLDFKLSGIDS